MHRDPWRRTRPERNTAELGRDVRLAECQSAKQPRQSWTLTLTSTVTAVLAAARSVASNTRSATVRGGISYPHGQCARCLTQEKLSTSFSALNVLPHPKTNGRQAHLVRPPFRGGLGYPSSHNHRSRKWAQSQSALSLCLSSDSSSPA